MANPQLGVTPPKKGRSCFLYGCLIAIVLILLVAGLVVFMIRKGLQGAVDAFTTTTPLPVPTVMVDPEVAGDVQARYKTFSDELSAHKVTEPLVFTAPEVNTLIATDPSFEILRGKVFVMFDGDQADITFNFPLQWLSDQVPVLGYLGANVAGRYVTGRAKGSLVLEGDELEAHVSALTLNGQTSPSDWIAQVNEALRQNRVIKTEDQDFKKLLEAIGRASITDGKLTIVGKRAGSTK